MWKGPPTLILRMLAPLLVLSTITLFGSGVTLVLAGSWGGFVGTVHVVSFVVWSALVVVHVLAYAFRALRTGRLVFRRGRSVRLPGAWGRRFLVVSALAAGVAVAVALYPHATVGRDFGRDDHAASAHVRPTVSEPR